MLVVVYTSWWGLLGVNYTLFIYLLFYFQGNETLVSEYEKSLAEITSLKGQVLKLESTLLESQIRSPIKSTADTQPEIQYWRR